MNYLIDTNVLSEARKSNCDRYVFEWIENTPRERQFISVVTLMEVAVGILRLERNDPEQALLLRHWFEDAVLPAFEGNIMELGVLEALATAELHVPSPGPYRDAQIAGTAAAHGMTIVTRNVKDFEKFGLPVINPWESQGPMKI